MTRYVMMAVGGALGAIARYQVTTLMQTQPATGFPWGTFVVNVSGCFIMGVATTLLTERTIANPQWRYLVPIGFIGAYTTFSAFEMELFRATSDAAWLVGGAYLVGSVVLGYLSLWLGVVVARVL